MPWELLFSLAPAGVTASLNPGKLDKPGQNVMPETSIKKNNKWMCLKAWLSAPLCIDTSVNRPLSPLPGGIWEGSSPLEQYFGGCLLEGSCSRAIAGHSLALSQ